MRWFTNLFKLEHAKQRQAEQLEIDREFVKVMAEVCQGDELLTAD